MDWQPDARGRLWSEVLELFLIAEGKVLRAMLPDGTRLLTYAESEAARAEEAAARRQAEEDVARLRAELDRLHDG